MFLANNLTQNITFINVHFLNRKDSTMFETEGQSWSLRGVQRKKHSVPAEKRTQVSNTVTLVSSGVRIILFTINSLLNDS
jgi:hypothetical protein